ncbi:hypothetical protein NSA47_02930 [Irregularibacter muris]|uniref:Uncharacterized protein n=1 Tax=Irregularibacter muris TaxID=1796619 RepID=A0AAE3HDD0_9FIRM|nr:hypothetical protein [Irregularibacter muris]MCR1897941.1 hypothetical protein [Irregularibacter muris]
MLNNQSKAYCITDNFLNLWIFQYTSRSEILYEVYNNQYKKIHSAILTTDCTEDFLLDIGKGNDIHLVLRKKSGEILYYFFNGAKWNILKLFDLENYKDSLQLLSLHIHKDKTHILYSIQKATNKWFFIDLFWENNYWNQIVFFESTTKPIRDTNVSIQDDEGNIYLICKCWNEQERQLQLFQFHEEANLWTQNILPFKKGNSPNIWIVENKIHLCYISSTDGIYRIHYLSKNTSPLNETQWERKIEVYSCSNKIYCPFFGLVENKLTLFWIEEQKLYYIQSNNMGKTWDPSCKVLAHISQYKLYRYLSEKQNFNNKAFYILFDAQNGRTCPISFFLKQEDYKKFQQNALSNSSDLNFISNTNKKEEIFLTDLVQIQNEKIFENPPSEHAKVYMKSLDEMILKLHKENNSLNKQQNTSSVFKNSNNPIQIKPEFLKTIVKTGENIGPKSHTLEYTNMVRELQKDTKNLKNEFNKKNTATDPLIDFKTFLLENQNQLMNALNSIEENSLSLNEVIDAVACIKKDTALIKEKITTIEKNENTKKGFSLFK